MIVCKSCEIDDLLGCDGLGGGGGRGGGGGGGFFFFFFFKQKTAYEIGQ